MNITCEHFGTTGEGMPVERFWLTEGAYAVAVLTLGGIIQSVKVPNREGIATDIALGFDSVQDYEAQTCYIGALLGRCANRIARGELSVGGNQFSLAWNDNGVCHLHGGVSGFDRKLWHADISDAGLVLRCTSPDGEEGYPGELQVSVTYQLADGALSLTYRAESTKDTLCNLSNHAYFNLSGHNAGSIGQQQIQVFADTYAVKNLHSVPTGEIQHVQDTPLDLRAPHRFAEHWDDPFGQIQSARGYDHHYFIDGTGMRPFARVYAEDTGIMMEVESDLPGMQLYSGNYLEQLPVGKNGAVYDMRSGFAIETQYAPNAVHCPNFAAPVLRSGEQYAHTTVYRFSNR
ncbi:aldose epimerase family protein [Butyricicoccus porcorum]|uniref:Aldose 1-epimerase n=1 Tax=Butyricicoccus porcorum TaxID=1945634 RepID=A0A252F3P1_9FIRM|nr:aldose epimerase family protein [Butyricicoccus porcorum]MCI6927194.1 galactose mutarotase [Butyricicoccus porcorum]MDD6986166.1 galactose mutarotase [Butyricicoccus porcorum]MDY4482488.1 aldose epimerase family protein [Butyricicoccus porcorum]OUM20311.1 hypothetical protein CBW42_08340 [Butyricicoccus porcorum]